MPVHTFRPEFLSEVKKIPGDFFATSQKNAIIRVMKKLLFVFLLLFSACSTGQVSVLDSVPVAEENLVIVGEGGTSGSLFTMAAETYVEEEGGVVYEVRSGDEFMDAVRNFYENYGEIVHLEYFGHGNHVALFVNQAPGVNGSVYANDPDQSQDYVAASIFDLPADVFYKYGWVRFNGCNVADGYPDADTFAQRFANYFEVEVVAPTGPTEFQEDGDEIYMIATYDNKDFVIVEPQEVADTRFVDVRVGQGYEEAVSELLKLGLDLGWDGDRFSGYKNITYAEAFEFCRLVASDENDCYISGYDAGEKIRNLQALRMLLDAGGVETAYTDPWYDAYIRQASDILTENFTDQMWYTRGEMAKLTWNFLQK